jgi:hypothetical protein
MPPLAVEAMLIGDNGNLLPNSPTQAIGKRGIAIFILFPFANDDLSTIKIHVFYAKPAAFEQSQAGSIHRFEHQSVDTIRDRFEQIV